MFERRENISEIGQPILRPGPRHDGETVRPFAAGDRSLPFAVAAVEHQDRVACGEPKHIAEIVALVALKRDRLAWRQRGIDEQPGLAEIVLRHARGVRFTGPFSPKDEN